MATPPPHHDLTVEEKTRIVLDAVLQIQKASDEEEAIVAAILHLERLNYPNIMFSCLRRIGGERFVVGSREFSTGDKWKAISSETQQSFDEPTDILPEVLRDRRSRFVRDSRTEADCDTDLCKRLNLVTQYVMPLATDSLPVGTLQVDMGQRADRPEVDCDLLDVIAAHLSVAIEKHRAMAQLEVANNELMNQTKLIVFEAAAADILHDLNERIGDYEERLKEAIKNPEIRKNKAAFDFLRQTEKSINTWLDSVEANILSLRRDEQRQIVEVEKLIRETVSIWQRKAQRRGCRLRAVYGGSGVTIEVKPGPFKEALACLIINAIEASARTIDIETSLLPASTVSPGSTDEVEIVVGDNGVGIPQGDEEHIRKFGWSSKTKGGHGMGLTVVELLVRSMGGRFSLRSGGLSAGQRRTEFVVRIPAVQ